MSLQVSNRKYAGMKRVAGLAALTCLMVSATSSLSAGVGAKSPRLEAVSAESAELALWSAPVRQGRLTSERLERGEDGIGFEPRLDADAARLEQELLQELLLELEGMSATDDADLQYEGTDHGRKIGGLFPSPDGQRVAIQGYIGPMPVVWIADANPTENAGIRRLTRKGFGFFMGWHPDSERLLVSVWDLDVRDPGLWVVQAQTGAHERIRIPNLPAVEALTAASFSPDGSTLLYAQSKGIGFGSEVYSMRDGKAQRKIWSDPYTVVSNLSWSPDGTQVAMTSLLDAPVPFANAGLWLMDPDGQFPELVGTMDGGHGQRPVWSPDGNQLYFVARDNPGDAAADYDAAALISSIRALDLLSGDESILVPSEGARHLDISLTSTGELVFASDRDGALEIWSLALGASAREHGLEQLTFDGQDKRHPLVVSLTASSAR